LVIKSLNKDDNNKKIIAGLDELRSSLSSYCVDVCKSQCCKKGKLLLLNSGEVNLISEGKKDELLLSKTLVKSESDNIHFDFSKNKNSCTKLCLDGLCLVYGNKNRPKVCSDYPLFKVKEFVMAADSCRAVREGVLDIKLNEFCKKYNLKLI